MAIRTAAEIHRLRSDPRASAPVVTVNDYRRAHAQAMHQIGIAPFAAETVPSVYVEGWKWCVACAEPDCDNRPAYGWGIACCFDCGAIYEGLTLPDDATEIERILALRPKLSQRTWLLTDTIADLQAENLSLGVSA